MKQILLLVSFIGLSLPLLAQITDDFSDGDFTQNPTWIGNTNYFQVTTGELQLNDANYESGDAYLTMNAPTQGETTWTFKVRMQFNPSSSNYTRVYLNANVPTLSGSSNGYLVLIGGSADVVQLRKQTGTSATTLITSADDVVDVSAPEVGIKVTRDAANNWELFADYTGGTNYVSIGTANDDSYPSGAYFGVRCKYTSTRKDKFFFDDFYVNPIFTDTEPPELLSVTPNSATEIALMFNEPISSTSASDPNNFSINNGLSITSSVLDASNPSTVIVTLNTPMTNLTEYTVSSTVNDAAGNAANGNTVTFTYAVGEEVARYDIVINEILPDPKDRVGMPELEFLELYNVSDKIIDIEGFVFKSGSSTSSPFPTKIMLPGDYVIISKENDTWNFDDYNNNIKLPSNISLTNSGDDVSLIAPNGSTIDAIVYDLTWYKDKAKDDGGWSLERINPKNPCEGGENWKVSQDPAGGTPGKQNSVYDISTSSTSPKIVTVFPSDETTILVTFSKAIDVTAAADVNNYSINNGLSIASVTSVEPLANKVIMSLNENLQVSTLYEITVSSSLTDCKGTAFENKTASFALPETIEKGDVIINEILFNPYSGGKDFIELYNNSNKIVDIADLVLLNDVASSSPNKAVEINYLLFPKSYIVLTEDPSTITEFYDVPNVDVLLTNDLPSFSNDFGNVTILTSNGVIDRLDYEEGYHMELLDNTKGVSLERIDFNAKTNDRQNWHSAAANVKYATPGYKNSQQILGDTTAISSDKFTLAYKTFSPDSDGYKDFLRIDYSLPKNGYLANIKVFDAKGRLIKNLVRSQNLATQGFYQWDGSNLDGEKARMGIYVIWIEYFDVNGKVQHEKKNCVLAGKLN